MPRLDEMVGFKKYWIVAENEFGGDEWERNGIEVADDITEAMRIASEKRKEYNYVFVIEVKAVWQFME